MYINFIIDEKVSSQKDALRKTIKRRLQNE